MTDLVWADAATPDEGAAQASDLFRDAFGYEPRGVWSAPGRVNIIGEHVDYNGGPCVPIALPHRAYVALSPREDRTIRLISPQTRDATDVLDLDVIGPKGTPGEVTNHWTAYLAGVAWALEQAGYGPLPGFDAALWSCVPLGGGLSSSAALECATAVALDEVCSLGLAGTIEAPNDEGRKVLVDAARAASSPKSRGRALSSSSLTRGRWRGRAWRSRALSSMTLTTRCVMTTRSPARSWMWPWRLLELRARTVPA